MYWSFLLFTLCLSALNAQAESLRVLKMSGNVRYHNQSVKVGDHLESGDILTVGAEDGSFVDLAFIEGHRARLGKGARLKLEGLKGASPSILNVLYGQLFLSFVKGQRAEKIQIRTPTAVAGVRGTKFLVQQENSGDAYFCVCEGVVEVHKNNESLIRKVTDGFDLWVRAGQPLEIPKASPGMAKMTASEFAKMGL